MDTKKADLRSVLHSDLENRSLSHLVNKMTSPIRIDTFDHFNIIKELANDARPVYDKANLDDRLLMFWKSVKVNDSNLYAVLITKR